MRNLFTQKIEGSWILASIVQEVVEDDSERASAKLEMVLRMINHRFRFLQESVLRAEFLLLDML